MSDAHAHDARCKDNQWKGNFFSISRHRPPFLTRSGNFWIKHCKPRQYFCKASKRKEVSVSPTGFCKISKTMYMKIFSELATKTAYKNPLRLEIRFQRDLLTVRSWPLVEKPRKILLITFVVETSVFWPQIYICALTRLFPDTLTTSSKISSVSIIVVDRFEKNGRCRRCIASKIARICEEHNQPWSINITDF